MKKILLAVVLVLTVGLCASAQRGERDGFFNNWSDVSNGLDEYDDFNNDLLRGGGPNTPGHGNDDTPAPLGSGLVVLTALGAGYAMKKRQREE